MIVVLGCCEAPGHRASGEQPVTALLGERAQSLFEERSLGGLLDIVTLKFFFLNNPFFFPSRKSCGSRARSQKAAI